MKKILIVEDEVNLVKGLRDNLEFEGYATDSATDGRTGLDKILNNYYDLVLLDVMLPEISGFDICRMARKEGIDTPVILLTARGEEIDKVVGLELGADDYITKPFSLRELLARIKAILRRSQDLNSDPPENDFVKIGNLKVNFKKCQVTSGDEEIKMSHKEIELLHYLHKNQGKTISRYDIIRNVWSIDNDITSRTVDNFILKLRQKAEEDPNNPRIILTVHGIGYKMIL